MINDADTVMSIFSEWFEEDHPSGYYTRGDGYDHTWTLTVSQGVGILRVVMEDVNTLDVEEFEWELTLRS